MIRLKSRIQKVFDPYFVFKLLLHLLLQQLQTKTHKTTITLIAKQIVLPSRLSSKETIVTEESFVIN